MYKIFLKSEMNIAIQNWYILGRKNNFKVSFLVKESLTLLYVIT